MTLSDITVYSIITSLTDYRAQYSAEVHVANLTPVTPAGRTADGPAPQDRNDSRARLSGSRPSHKDEICWKDLVCR